MSNETQIKDKTLVTPFDERLQLVDFSAVNPTDLQTQVTGAIDKGNAFLDALGQETVSAKQALADIIEFDHIGLDLDRSWGIVSHLNSVMSGDEIRHTHHELLPLLSAFGTRVGQDKALYERYVTVKNDSDFFKTLSPARQRAITLAIQGFELSGVALDDDKQNEYGKIQTELSSLSAKFSDNVMDATQAFNLPLNESQLAGIPETGLGILAANGERLKAKLSEDGQDIADLPTPYYVATLDIPAYMAVMTHADDRALRETLYHAYVTRASEFGNDKDTHNNAYNNADNNVDNSAKSATLDNSPIMEKILALRTQKAVLLGFNNYSELSLSKKMADDVAQVDTFLRDLADKATPFAKKDLAQLQAEASTYGIEGSIEPWDSGYLAEKVKQRAFNLSQEDIRPYFPLPKVIDGLFTIVNKLFGIRAEEHSDSVNLWHDEVRFYQLFDKDDSLIGGFYFDLYARAGKRGGAWMSGFQPRYEYVNESSTTVSETTIAGYEQLPVCFMVGNFTPPTAGAPSLLTHNEVTTLFHEFGHGLHHLLTAVTIGDVAGVNGVEWDAVELPSQFLENWAWEVEGINLISAHVETGEPLPQDKLQALLSAKNFQSGMQTLRQIEFALFDLLIHAQNPAPDYAQILQTLQNVRDDISITETPSYNRFANGFSHIFAGGYAAGYYSYKWAELLSADAFGRFEEDGVFNKETGQAFRDSVLAVGGSLPAKNNFEAFRGRAASIDALLRHSGFTSDSEKLA